MPLGELLFSEFRRSRLFKEKKTDQKDYLIEYLSDLGAKTVIEEQQYFDRDYLSEFSDFYSMSSAGYRNTCRRLHFFIDKIDRKFVERAAGGDEQATQKLQTSYIGFSVIRPIPHAPFGRTVIKWYPDPKHQTPRITEPSRLYKCHIAGIQLTIKGLAWQQQDTGISSCSTIALWTMLHSSAFDEYLAIPTTSAITKIAHNALTLDKRKFPSTGLNPFQVCEVIDKIGMVPLLFRPDNKKVFSREHFSSICGSLIRSGYPLLLGGTLIDKKKRSVHAVCCVGYRESAYAASSNKNESQDKGIQFLYIHDDNLGPNVRFEIKGSDKSVKLVASTPQPISSKRKRISDPTGSYPEFIPESIVAAVHDNLRLSLEFLQKRASDIGYLVMNIVNSKRNKNSEIGITTSIKFRKISDYAKKDLDTTLLNQSKILSRVRLALWENLTPISRYIGIVRFGTLANPLMDILYDTTDVEQSASVFCTILFKDDFAAVMKPHLKKQYGKLIDAF